MPPYCKAAHLPPSTMIVTPLIHEASSEAAKRMTFANSSGRPKRFIGCASRRRSPGLGVSRSPLQQRRLDVARRDAVYAYAERRVLIGRRLRQMNDPGLGNLVGNRRCRPPERGHRGHVDDGAPARLPHGGKRVLAAEKRAPEIHLHHPVPVRLLGVLQQRRIDERGGAVHQDVQRAEPVERFVDHLLDLTGPGHVGGDVRRRAARPLYVPQRFPTAGLVDVGDHDARAFRGESRRRRPTDARTRAGDDGGLPSQPIAHPHVHFLTMNEFYHSR